MRFKLVKRSIQDEEADQVVELARWGMARKTIASEVYGAQVDGKPSNSSCQRVHHILREWGVGVTEYRNGKNANGRGVISAIRQELDILDAIRSGCKEVTAALRQTG